ncbi:hypothetical protein HRG_013995 [Hirsutella rhossiliensis]
MCLSLRTALTGPSPGNDAAALSSAAFSWSTPLGSSLFDRIALPSGSARLARWFLGPSCPTFPPLSVRLFILYDVRSTSSTPTEDGVLVIIRQGEEGRDSVPCVDLACFILLYFGLPTRPLCMSFRNNAPLYALGLHSPGPSGLPLDLSADESADSPAGLLTQLRDTTAYPFDI